MCLPAKIPKEQNPLAIYGYQDSSNELASWATRNQRTLLFSNCMWHCRGNALWGEGITILITTVCKLIYHEDEICVKQWIVVLYKADKYLDWILFSFTIKSEYGIWKF